MTMPNQPSSIPILYFTTLLKISIQDPKSDPLPGPNPSPFAHSAYAGDLSKKAKSVANSKGLKKHALNRRADHEDIIIENCIQGNNCQNFTVFSKLNHDILKQYIIWVTFRRCLKKLIFNYYKVKDVRVAAKGYKPNVPRTFDFDSAVGRQIEIGFTHPSIQEIRILDENIWQNDNKRYLLNCMNSCEIGYIRVKKAECDILKSEQGYYMTKNTQTCCRKINSYPHDICSRKTYASNVVVPLSAEKSRNLIKSSKNDDDSLAESAESENNSNSKNKTSLIPDTFIDICTQLTHAIPNTCSPSSKADNSEIQCQCQLGYRGRLCDQKACYSCIADQTCYLEVSANECKCMASYRYGESCENIDYGRMVYEFLGREFSFVIMITILTMLILLLTYFLHKTCFQRSRRKRRESRKLIRRQSLGQVSRARINSKYNKRDFEPYIEEENALNENSCSQNRRSTSRQIQPLIHKNSHSSRFGPNNGTETNSLPPYRHTHSSMAQTQCDPIFGELPLALPSNHSNHNGVPMSINGDLDNSIIALPSPTCTQMNTCNALDENVSKAVITTLDKHIKRMGSLRSSIRNTFPLPKPDINSLPDVVREEQLEQLANFSTRSLRRIYSTLPEGQLQFDERMLAIEEKMGHGGLNQGGEDGDEMMGTLMKN